MVVKLILDMDGVVADFVTALCKTHALSSPYDNGYERWDIESSTEFGHMSRNQMFKPCRDAAWWENIPKTPEADHIVETCLELVGIENIVVCTATTLPVGACTDGKIAWWKKLYPKVGLHDRVIATPHKHFLASPYSILIDDKESNIDDFQQHGGNAMMIPRPWNRLRHTTFFNFRDSLEANIGWAKQRAERCP